MTLEDAAEYANAIEKIRMDFHRHIDSPMFRARIAGKIVRLKELPEPNKFTGYFEDEFIVVTKKDDYYETNTGLLVEDLKYEWRK